MFSSEVVINEDRCHGCGYCVQFCPRECLEMDRGKIGPLGCNLPVVVKAEQCNTCGICARMCPHWAVEVFATLEVPGEATIREKVAGLPRLMPSPPLANCAGCQHPTVGRIIAGVIDELKLKDNFVAFDGISCGGSTVLSLDFGQVVGTYDDPIEMALAAKHAHPDKIVLALLNSPKFDITGYNSLMRAMTAFDKITVINCNDPLYGPWPKGWRVATPVGCIVPVPDEAELAVSENHVPMAEMAATFKGVAYSARGALTSVDDYEHTRNYIRTAIQKQVDNVGVSLVDVLCACLVLSYEAPVDCLRWIKEEMVTKLPLGIYKNTVYEN